MNLEAREKKNQQEIPTNAFRSFSIGVISLLLAAASIYFSPLIAFGLKPWWQNIFNALLIAYTLFFLGYSLFEKVASITAKTTVAKFVLAEISRFDAIEQGFQKRMAELDSITAATGIRASVRGLECLKLMRQIIRAMAVRNEEARELLSINSAESVAEAYEIISADLESPDNAVADLVVEDPLPPLKNEDIEDGLSRLFREAYLEIRQAA